MIADHSEILNLYYNTGILLLKALNRSSCYEDAARILGMSERNIFVLKKQYNIFYNKHKDLFEINLKAGHFQRKNLVTPVL